MLADHGNGNGPGIESGRSIDSGSISRGVGVVAYAECFPSGTVTKNVGGPGWIVCVAFDCFVSPCAVLTNLQADLDVPHSVSP
jgi:hypothetical protein